MTQRDSYFMQKAIDLAKKGIETNSGGPFGAVIVKDDKIIGKGFNQVTSTNDPTAHAEIVAIKEACKRLNSFQLDDCVIYTSCEPCPMCLGAIYWARPKKVYFACKRDDAANIDFDDQFIYDEIKKQIGDRHIEFSCIMREEAMKVFKAWQNKPDKIEY